MINQVSTARREIAEGNRRSTVKVLGDPGEGSYRLDMEAIKKRIIVRYFDHRENIASIKKARDADGIGISR